jgi:hypothetical protein
MTKNAREHLFGRVVINRTGTHVPDAKRLRETLEGRIPSRTASAEDAGFSGT